MSQQPTTPEEPAVEVVGPDEDGQAMESVEQPAKVMRIGTMIKQLLEEVRTAPLDDASRNRLRDIHASSIRADSLNRSSRRAAPSSIENSVWVCRWTKLSADREGAAMGCRLLRPHAVPAGSACARDGSGVSGSTVSGSDALGRGRQTNAGVRQFRAAGPDPSGG